MLATSARQLCLLKNFNACTVVTSFKIRKISQSSEPNVVLSKVPDIEIPKIFLEEYLWKRLDKWHDKTAVVCAETGRSYLYSEIYKKSRALTNFLYKFPKLKQNDTVAIIFPNVPEYPIAVMGIIQAGLKLTPINPFYTPDEFAKQLLSSETKMVITLTELWPKIKKALEISRLDIPIVVVNHKQDDLTPLGAIKFKEIVEGDHKAHFQLSRSTDDILLLPYSSGTTGIPKGVELTSRNLVSNLHQMAAKGYKLHRDTEGSEQEVVPAVLPIFHVYGFSLGTLNMLASGCKLVTIPTFGSQIFIKVLKEYKPTFTYLVPPLILFLLNTPQVLPEYISQIRTIISGAAPLGAADVERLREKSNGKLNLLQAYGLTEMSPLTHTQTVNFSNGVKVGGSGFALPNTECKIIAVDDKTETALGPHKSGELVMRGPQVMKGYYKNPEATQAVLNSNGWLKTGDIAYYDEDGHFFITDRLKEFIKVKGFQVAPAELEELLRDHPDVEDAAVIGVPHSAFGEVPKAFLVTKKGNTLNKSKIQEYVATKAAKYKQLVGGIVVVDSIPRSQSGKILRRQLKEL